MVSTRSSKAVKPTYAERVLGAFGQIQKEQKRHTVHLASIRAQVKKNAQEKKDKLGPNWSQWVTKAVAKLEEEEILEPAPAAGSVALTQKGKKAIMNARKSLRLSLGGISPDRYQEDSVWKEVTSQGLKRSRRPSTVPGSMAGDSPTKSASARKRPRVSFAGGKKPVSRMTKAELKAELATLQRAHVLLRDTSPLTDLDDDDEVVTTQLREELKERDEELESLRQQLALARRRSETESISSGRYATPENFARPATPPRQTNVVTSRQYPGGVVRTESGSFIPVVSKQPTPAPSSPERDVPYNERDVELPDFDMGDSANPTVSSDDGPALVASLKAEVQTLQTLIAGKTGEVTVLEKTVQSLESMVRERDAIGDTLRAEVTGMNQSWRQAEEKVTARDTELATLQGVVESLRAEGEGFKNRLTLLESANARLESELEQSRIEYINVKSEKDSLATLLKAAKNEIASLELSEVEKKAKIHALIESLENSANEVQMLRETGAKLEESLSKYKSELQQQREALVDLENRLRDRDAEVERLSTRLGGAESSVEAISAKLTDAEAMAAALSLDLSLVKTAAGNVEATLADTRTQVEVEEAHHRRLEEELAAKDGEISSKERDAEALRLTVRGLKDELRAKDDAIHKLQGEFEGTQRRLTTTETARLADGQRHEAERRSLSAQIIDLQTSLDSARSRADGLSSQLRTAEAEQGALRKDLAEKIADIANANAELKAGEEERAALEADLVARVGKTQELEGELRAFKIAKEADERTIVALKASFVRMKEGQAKLFGDLDKTIASAQASSAPNADTQADVINAPRPASIPRF
ncbi:unnamed protein product [Cyclocybe aegerita]|uniref:Uncharacterized protein n=1 Tax=Cyclocybe aegerita TaxID=1973307 RepID=A0A8S0WQH2_CYCAE|nr:unnamed protein product [Cyclocybe aegerita]